MKPCVVMIACVSACATVPGIDDPSEGCIERAPASFRTRFAGSGLVEFEGRTVHVVTTINVMGGVRCRAASRATVVAGGFGARTDNRRDDAVYPRLGAYVDLDNDGTCGAEADLVWTHLSIAPPPDQVDTIELTSNDFAKLPEGDGCGLLR